MIGFFWFCAASTSARADESKDMVSLRIWIGEGLIVTLRRRVRTVSELREV